MAAFGSYAGHERRGSLVMPQRSAILGLIGAAMGIDRSNSEAQTSLRNYRVATQSLTVNKHLRDYHTVQTVPRKIQRPDSRKTAIEAAGLGVETSITIRDYRSDVAIAVGVWNEVDEMPLSDAEYALEHPHFSLYVGRKSCPLSAPMNPTTVFAPDPLSAIRKIQHPSWLPKITPGPIACDPFQGGEPDRIELYPVEPIDRTFWHFTQSEVWFFDRTEDS